MNKERLLQLADVIEKKPHQPDYMVLDAKEGFAMSRYTTVVNECETPACIAGHALFMFDRNSFNNIWNINISKIAADVLGLDASTANELFYVLANSAWRQELRWANITPQHAAHTIRHLVETGEVDWTHYLSQGGN